MCYDAGRELVREGPPTEARDTTQKVQFSSSTWRHNRALRLFLHHLSADVLDVARAGEKVAVLVERQGHDAFGRVEGFLETDAAKQAAGNEHIRTHARTQKNKKQNVQKRPPSGRQTEKPETVTFFFNFPALAAKKGASLATKAWTKNGQTRRIRLAI